MKTLKILTLIVLVSCTKNNKELLPRASQYTVTFEMENESKENVYLIQVSKDKNVFYTIDSIPFSANNKGVYEYNLAIKGNELIRIATKFSDRLIYSQVMAAD